MCFYDLQKAFDSIQYPILLKRLFEAGVDGRVWRLLRSWYTSPRCRVKINGSFSSAITLERGFLQGSVLSPILFLLIMDPLLHHLQCQGLGPSIGETYAGAFIHADDIHTVSSSLATLQQQIDTVHTFAVQNGLTLNPNKCEVLMVSSTKPSGEIPTAVLGNQALVPQHQAKMSWVLVVLGPVSIDSCGRSNQKGKKSFLCLWSYGRIPSTSQSNLHQMYIRDIA